jgi:hypothetical protein
VAHQATENGVGTLTRFFTSPRRKAGGQPRSFRFLSFRPPKQPSPRQSPSPCALTPYRAFVRHRALHLFNPPYLSFRHGLYLRFPQCCPLTRDIRIMPPKSQKRKRTSTHEASPSVRKKAKSKQSSQAESAASEDSQFEVRAILHERKVGRRIDYLLDWEPHPVTGETWSPSWAAAKDVGFLLIKEWNDKKSKAQPQPLSLPQPQQTPETQAQSTTDLASELSAGSRTPLPNAQRQARRRRVIHSSPLPEPAPPSPHQVLPLVIQETPGSPRFSAESSPLSHQAAIPSVEDNQDRPVAHVHVTQQDDFDPNEYHIGLTQILPPRSPHSTVAESERTPQPTLFELRTVIPDSQSLPAASSLDTTSVPTQGASGSTEGNLSSSGQEVSLMMPVETQCILYVLSYILVTLWVDILLT